MLSAHGRRTAGSWSLPIERAIGSLHVGHVCTYGGEELWAQLGGPYSVHQQPWPVHDEAALEEKEVTLVVQVNGRVRARLRVPAGLAEAEALRLALAAPAVATHLDGRGPRKVVHVPDRLLNLVP